MHLLLPASITRACHVADAMLGVRGTIAEQGPILAQPLPTQATPPGTGLKMQGPVTLPNVFDENRFFFFPLSFIL